MSLQVQNENKNKQEIELTGQVLGNLTAKYFSGRNAEILTGLLAEFEFKDLNQFMQTIFAFLDQKIDLASLNNTEIEQLDVIGLAKELASELNYKEPSIEISEKDSTKFEKSLKEFSHSALHDVAFPLILMESPHAAVSAKNLIKRVVSSMQIEEGVDMSDVYQTLDIENLPTEFNMDMFLRLGGSIPGFEQQTEVNEEEKEVPSLLFCELTAHQTIYLAHILQKDYYAIKNWKTLFHLLKSNGKKYDSLIVECENKGILLSVLDLLHKKRDITDTRYLRANKGNGIWPFFQGFLIDSKTDQQFSRELRQVRNENCRKIEAQKIIDEIFDPAKTNIITQTAQEIINKEGI